MVAGRNTYSPNPPRITLMDFVFGPQIATDTLRLVNEAREVLIVVTPYFRPWELMRFALEGAAARKGSLKCALIVRGGDEQEKNEKAVAPYQRLGIPVHFLERLHAKLYINEKEAIITSMNLVDASQSGSWEIACRVVKADNPKEYGEVMRCFNELAREVKAHEERQKHAAARGVVSEPPSRGAPAGAQRNTAAATPRKPAKLAYGHCIRCGEDVPLDPAQPLCKGCYAAWARYRNDEYEEKFCHSCGKKSSTSMVKPLCRQCYAAT
jgi:hypothetical protein